MACIWRDACVVRQAFRYREAGAQSRGERKPKKSQARKIVLPRTVTTVTWGGETERQRFAEERKPVRPHYRRLLDGQQASDAARANADRLRQPTPPTGFTFVASRSFTDGLAGVTVEDVVCRGLQVASIIMSGRG